MARPERKYNEYYPIDRPKLPRNKYGMVENNYYGSSSAYSSSMFNAGAQVGAEMEDLKTFGGATNTEPGSAGIVPAPEAGMNNWYYLRGSGGWDFIAAAKWLYEWPASEGLEKTGLGIDGNFNVSDTITTMNLEVQGAAHFWTLIIDEVKANGGQLLVSPSMFHVDYVGEVVQYYIFDTMSPLIQMLERRTDIYNILKANGAEYIRCRRLYQRCDDGEKAIRNECQVGDMMRCRSFNVKADVYRNISNTDYWSFVVNTGEDKYTDEDGNTYDAIWIDLAFTLRKADGHNIPLGSTLYLDGRTPKTPNGFTEVMDALELKRVSQETWDGTRDVVNEFYENSEWTDITEYVIKIRGLDDQAQELTGRSAEDKLYDREDSLNIAKESLDQALYGNGSSLNQMSADTLSTSDLDTAADIVLHGRRTMNAPSRAPLNETINDVQDLTQTIIGPGSGINNDDIPSNGLVSTTRSSTPYRIARGTVVGTNLVVDEVVTQFNEDSEQEEIIYNPGDVIGPGTTVPTDITVHDVEPIDIVQQENLDTGVVTSVDSDQEDQINGNVDSTPSGMSTNPDRFNIQDYASRTEWRFGYVGYYPQFRIKEGDALACLGHLYDETRQNAIVLSSTNPIDPELEAPAMAQYHHIDLFGESISKYRMTAIAANGNEFIGRFLVNYNSTYMDINERINMFILDMKTGLEKVGIHLDGDKSTITLVGSVDLRQHKTDDGYDTLNLYDKLDVKRVEITPFPLPQRGSSDAQVDSTKLIFTPSTGSKNVTAPYVSREKGDLRWDNGIIPERYWDYTLSNYNVIKTTSVSIGYLKKGYMLDLRDMNLIMDVEAYFNGNIVAKNHGIDQQRVNGLNFTLKKDGEIVTQFNNTPVTDYPTPGGINTGNIMVYVPMLVNDYTIPSSGTYTLEVTLSVMVYAYYEHKDKLDNYYFTVNGNLSGNVFSDVARIETSTGEGSGDAYKMTIGTNGFQFNNNNSRYFYAANDGFEMKWDNAGIRLDDDYGLYIRHNLKSVNKTTQLGNESDIILCENTHTSYTVYLPEPMQYGQGRMITILGWVNFNGGELKLSVPTGSASRIEIMILTSVPLTEVTFGTQSNIAQTIQLLAVGNTWRAISVL